MKRNSIELQTNPSLVILMAEFEKEGLRMSKRISKSNQGSTAGTPLSLTPPLHSTQQQQQHLHIPGGTTLHSPLSMSSSLIAPQTSPWILGYALDDMSRFADEIAVLPHSLVPLHPFIDSQSLQLIIHYFQPLIIKNIQNHNQHTHHRSNSTNGSTGSANNSPNINFNMEKLTIMLTRSISSFSNKHQLLSRLQLNREQLVWIIYLMTEHFYHRFDSGNPNGGTHLSELSISASSTFNSLSASPLNLESPLPPLQLQQHSQSQQQSQQHTRKTHYEIINSLLPIQSPFISDDDYSAILKPTENYNDISHSFSDISKALGHLLDWLAELFGLSNGNSNSNNSNTTTTTISTSASTSSSTLSVNNNGAGGSSTKHRRTNSTMTPSSSVDAQLAAYNSSMTEILSKLLLRVYNLVKVGAVVPVHLSDGVKFHGFLPIPHHLINSIVHKSNVSDPYSSSMNWFDIACRQQQQQVQVQQQDLVAVLKRRLFRDSPIHLGDVEIITASDFAQREQPTATGQRAIDISEDYFDQDLDCNYDLIPNEDLMLFYGYTLDDYDYICLEFPVYKTAEQLERDFPDKDELAREQLLAAAKLKILGELGIGMSAFKTPGIYCEMITRDKPLGINLLDVSRVAKLREFEAYFYEPGQCETMITYRNELEVLVYQSQILHRILDSITSRLKAMFLSVSSESNIQLPTELERYYKNHQSIVERSLQQLAHQKSNLCKPANRITNGFIRPSDAVYRKFEKWLASDGVQCPKLQIANFQDSTGRGIVTTKKVEENEVIIKVPRKFLINVQVAREHPILGRIFEEFSGLNDDTILFLFVIYEKENPNSFWRPFFDTLPSYFPTSIHYTSTELLELEGTNLFAETLQVKEHLQSIRDMLFPELSEQYPTIFPESLFSWENFLWARSLFDSRAIQLKIDDKITNCLVPMADMINHHHNAQISQRFFDQTDQCFKMVSCCSVPPNAQIFLHYGALQNRELALYYGFVIQDNPYDSMLIGFDLPDEDTPEITKSKQDLLAANLLSIDTHYLRKSNIPPKVLAALRVALMTPEECNPYVDIWNPITRRNEESMLHTLYSTVLMFLKQFSSSWEEDKQLCEQVTSRQKSLLSKITNSKERVDRSGSSGGSSGASGNHQENDDDDDQHEDDDDANEQQEDDDEQQSSEQMKIVLQYRIEQKQILTGTLQKIIERMTEMGIEIPKSPSEYSDDEQDYNEDDQDDEDEDDDDEQYFSDSEE